MNFSSKIKSAIKSRWCEFCSKCLRILRLRRLVYSVMYRLNIYQLNHRAVYKLNLGSGDTLIDGFCSIDTNPYSTSDLIGGIDKLRLCSNSVEIIYCSHVFEHLPRDKCSLVLKEWLRVLKPGGRLYLGVPDLEAIFRCCLEQLSDYEQSQNAREKVDLAMGIIYGGQGNRYNFHYNGHSFVTLKMLLESVGFVDISRFNWQSVEFKVPSGDGISATLTGLPISLNIRACKKQTSHISEERK